MLQLGVSSVGPRFCDCVCQHVGNIRNAYARQSRSQAGKPLDTVAALGCTLCWQHLTTGPAGVGGGWGGGGGGAGAGEGPEPH